MIWKGWADFRAQTYLPICSTARSAQLDSNLQVVLLDQLRISFVNTHTFQQAGETWHFWETEPSQGVFHLSDGSTSCHNCQTNFSQHNLHPIVEGPNFERQSLGMQRRLSEEFERCQVYLDASTRKPLIQCVETQLIEQHMGSILERGYTAMVTQHQVGDLARLYSLAARVGALERLKQAFKEDIKTTGEDLVMDAQKVSPRPYFCPCFREVIGL